MILNQAVNHSISRSALVLALAMSTTILPIGIPRAFSDDEPARADPSGQSIDLEATRNRPPETDKSVERQTAGTKVTSGEVKDVVAGPIRALKAEIKVSQNFFVVPVNTEFQKWRLQSQDIVAFASIDGMSFIDLNSGTIDTNRFDFKALRKTLRSVREKCGRGTLKVEIDFGIVVRRPEVDTFVEGALARMGKDAGFENVEFIKSWSNEDAHQWKGLPEADGTHHNEARLGNDAVLIFPLQTPLGRFLAGGVDCYIEIPGPLSLEARRILSDADKAAIGEAIGKTDMADDATVRLHVHLQKPEDRGTIQDLPQVKKDSEFHRDAVDYLMSLGFDQISIDVDIHSSVFHSRYK